MCSVDSSSSSSLHIRSANTTETTLELSTKGNYNGSLPSAKISFTQQNGTEIARIKCDTNTGAANMADLTFWTNYGGLYERMRITKTGTIQIGGAVENSGDLDASNTRLTIKQSANNQEDGIYIERSGERRGYYMYVGGAGAVSYTHLTLPTNREV